VLCVLAWYIEAAGQLPQPAVMHGWIAVPDVFLSIVFAKYNSQ
jgi:hypothetical protein